MADAKNTAPLLMPLVGLAGALLPLNRRMITTPRDELWQAE